MREKVRYIFCVLFFISFGSGGRLGLSKRKSNEVVPRPRIVGGQPANISDYPYQVAILYENKHRCGGSIIQVNFILTAAHCINGLQEADLSIRAGSSFHKSGGQVVPVQRIFLHPNFNSNSYDYDIAVLRLRSSLVLGSKVVVIEMVASGTKMTNGKIAVATGWGQLSYNGESPEQLQAVSLPTINTKSCQNYYGRLITPRMFCAGYPQGGKDTCQGDSGGPLVYNGTLIGITSWGRVCANPGEPGTFTKVSVLRNFVNKIIAP